MSKAPSITRNELKSCLAEKGKCLLLDVVAPEYFAEEHLPTARSACVYEVNFLDQVRALTSDPSQPIVVYASSANSKASSEAARKLTDAGYSRVRQFRGGLAEWKRAGWPLEGTAQPPPAPKLEDRSYLLDPAASAIEWTGRNLANKHTGTLLFSSGEIAIRRAKVESGQFVIDLRSIANSDLQDANYRQLLLHHLASDDFFDVARFPEARFVIAESKPIADATPGQPNCTIHGTLHLKGVARPVDFPATIGPHPEGGLVAQAHLDFDRTLWEVLYGSGKFFEKLGRHLVNDLVSIQLKIVAR